MWEYLVKLCRLDTRRHPHIFFSQSEMLEPKKTTFAEQLINHGCWFLLLTIPIMNHLNHLGSWPHHEPLSELMDL